MPLRQPPAERSFSLIPPNWNPVSNDRVLPHLGPLLILNSILEYDPRLVIRFATPVRLISDATDRRRPPKPPEQSKRRILSL